MFWKQRASSMPWISVWLTSLNSATLERIAASHTPLTVVVRGNMWLFTFLSTNFPFERMLQQQQVWRCWSLLVYGVRYEWTRSFTDLNARLIRHNRTHLLDLSIVSVVLAMEMLGVSCSKQNSMVTSDWCVRRAIHFYWLFMGWKGNAVIELINQQDTLTERL